MSTVSAEARAQCAARLRILHRPGRSPRRQTNTGDQDRCRDAQRADVPRPNYDICTGVLILNLNPNRIRALDGRDSRSVSSDIEVALNALAGFYDPVRLEQDPTWRAF